MAFGEKKSFFGRLKEGLTKTKDNMVGKIEDVIFQRPEIDEDMMEELEETLILSDIGMETTGKIIDRLRRDIKAEKLDTPEKVMEQIKKIISELIAKDAGYALSSSTPLVLLMIGVNGSGKTTSIAKIAHMLKQDGKRSHAGSSRYLPGSGYRTVGDLGRAGRRSCRSSSGRSGSVRRHL